MMDGGSLWKEGFARVNVGALACVTVLLLSWTLLPVRFLDFWPDAL